MSTEEIVQQPITPEPSDSDEAIVLEFQNGKAEAERQLEQSGFEAGVRFVNTSRKYIQLHRLDRWRDEAGPTVFIEDVGASGLADVLAGGRGVSDNVFRLIESLGGGDVNEGQWLEGFVDGALDRFHQIKAKL